MKKKVKQARKIIKEKIISKKYDSNILNSQDLYLKSKINKDKYVKKLTRLYMLLFVFVALTSFILASSGGFFIRLVGAKEIDDVSPDINCTGHLLNKVDVLNVIPKFNNKSIADNPEWCKKILSLNKTLAMHGIYHTYDEFGTNKDDKYVEEGIDIFVKCFGKKPSAFKPPQLDITQNNMILIKKYMQLHLFGNERLRKVYHCSDTGIVKNAAVDIYAVKDWNGTM